MSKVHDDLNLVIDTFDCKDNVFLYIQKDGSSLLDELYSISLLNFKIAQSYTDRFSQEQIEVYSYRKEQFISLFYTNLDIGIRRDYIEKCLTYIVRNNNVYQVQLLATPYVNRCIDKKIKNLSLSCRERFERRDFYDFCMINGNIKIRPIPYSAIDDDGGVWIEIPFSEELKFKLISTSQIKNNMEEWAR